MRYAILAVLCLATTVFGAVSYDATNKIVTLSSASDLSTMVDPLGQGQDLTDPATMMGNLTKDAFNALSGLQVIDFNAELTPATFNATSTINAAYDASHALTLTNFGDPNGYNYGGGTSDGRVQYSGPNAYDQLGTVGGVVGAAGTYHLPAPAAMGLNWFAASLSVNEANAGVSAVGFVVDGRTSQNTDTGNIWVTLSDATEVSYPYVNFGGDVANPPGIGFFYQAPAGKFITRVECTRDDKGGNSYEGLDDLGFVISRTGVTQLHPGDANNDGAVDVVDLGILARNYDTLTGATWAMGDFNADGAVDVIDLGTLARNYDWTGAPAGAVPEPMTLSLLAVGAAALIRRKR